MWYHTGGHVKYSQIETEWDTQKQFRKELKDKPSELKRYEDKLKEAIMMRNRSDAYDRKGKKLQHISWIASAKAYVKMH